MPTAPTAEQLADVEACREAARRYCRGVDRLDPDEMRSAYWPDATDEHGRFDGNAWDFVDLCMTGHDRWAFTMHTISNHTVELDDDGTHARGEVYNVTWLRRADEDLVDVWHGRYLDRYEKRGDEWRILRRVCVHEGDMTLDAGASMPIGADSFTQGSFDRRTPGRRLGPN
ncbi:MAG: nuclear transport factor 2 family protein [Ilumatobacteraceae bacterium]